MPVKSKKVVVKHVLMSGGLQDLNTEVEKLLVGGYRILEARYLNGDLNNNIFTVFYIFTKDEVVTEE